MNFSLCLFVLLATVTISDACFGMMGGGGGGGCGGGCSPPPPMCGCGSRKKRSVPETPAFFGLAATDDEKMCNTPELKKIILQNMHNTTTDSSKAINGELEVRQLSRFVVVCSENAFAFSVRADTAYCGAEKNGHNCHAFSL